MLKERSQNELDDLTKGFANARPFKHICIDNFFSNEVANSLLRDFPNFADDMSKNEFGQVGQKAVFERISDISDFYSTLCRYLESTDFHNVIEKITGIPNLRWGGESMYGGGTHENLNGAELDPHVDFNYDDRTKEHRRLNLLIYLNKDWQPEWGGSLELHSNPRDPDTNEYASFPPIFNRAIIMETNEHSWHGFPRISLPEGEDHRSRKSLALYFYTKERPLDEVTGGHATFYVQRPLPKEFAIGNTISKEIFNETTHLVHKRDQFLFLHQRKEIEDANRIAILENTVQRLTNNLRIRTVGCLLQTGPLSGLFDDDWMGSSFAGTFTAVKDIKRVSVHFYVPEHATLPMNVELVVNDHRQSTTINSAGVFVAPLDIETNADTRLEISAHASHTTSGKDAGINGDERQISVNILYLESS